MAQPPLILAVDAGGSKTAALLAVLEPQGVRMLGNASGPAANPKVMSLEDACRAVQETLYRCFQRAELAPVPADAICIGMAGAGRVEEQQSITEWMLHHQVAAQVSVVPDIVPVLYSVDPAGVGIALVVGTGSIAMGRVLDGPWQRCGGWGPHMGDEGSGYAIGCAALRAVARMLDGRGSSTALWPALQSYWNVVDEDQLIQAVYAQPGRKRIAAQVPAVAQVAANGDAVARQILDQAVFAWTDLVVTLSRKIGFSAEQYRLALGGGVLTHHASLRLALQDALAERQMPPQFAHIVDDPLQGSVRLAELMVRDHAVGFSSDRADRENV